MYSILRNNRGGISTIVATFLLLGIVIAAAAYLAGFMGSFMNLKATPSAQVVVLDHPNLLSSGFAFVIRHIGGDAIRFDNLMVVVYDSSKNIVYSGLLDSDNFIHAQLSAEGYNSSFFETGEQIIAKKEVIEKEGVYEIAIYYTPSNSLICSRQISIS